MSSLDHERTRPFAGTRSITRADSSRRRRGQISVQLLMLLVTTLVGVPVVALGATYPQWFQLWSGGAPMLLSGEGIGTLPCYVTPDATAPVPGATHAENELQLQPAIQVDVPYDTIYDTVVDGSGTGYAFISPGTGSTQAKVRVFGDVAVTIDPNQLEGRQRTVYWNVGPAFDGATLHFAIGDLASFGTKVGVSGALMLPVESDVWKAAFDKGVVSLILVRADGAMAALHIDEIGGAIVAIQAVP